MRSRMIGWLAVLLLLWGAAPAAATNHEPVTKWIRVGLPVGYPEYHDQEFLFRVDAQAGPLRLSLSHYEPAPAALFAYAVLKGGQVLGEGMLTTAQTEATVTLPAAGTYLLWLLPQFEWMESTFYPQLSLSAAGLAVQETFAGFVNVADYPEYHQVTAPMDLVIGPASSESYIKRISVNGEVIYEARFPDAGPLQLHLDPASTADGIYWLEMEAETIIGQNLSYTYRSFLFDQEAQYSDVPHWHWARQPVEIMSHLAILNGRGDGTFDPEAPVSRKEFAKMMALTFDLTATAPSPFEDAPNDWSQPYIDALFEAGLITGEIEDGKRYFRPDRSISRAEAATMIGRALEVADADVSFLQPLFLDDGLIPAWARPSVAVLSVERWLSGFPDGSFSPHSQLSRAQAAKILAHALGLVPGDRDSGAPRPPGVPSDWMQGWGGAERRSWNGAFSGSGLAPLWTSRIYPVKGSFTSNLAVGNGLLYVFGQRGRIYGLLPGSGAVLWETVVGGPSDAPGEVLYSAAHNLVYATTWKEQVVALHPVTGKRVWESAERWTLVNRSPVVVGDLVIGGRGALDAATGAVVWEKAALANATVAASGERLFAAFGRGRVSAYRATDGSLLWERSAGHVGASAPPVVGHGLVFVEDIDDHMLALDEATGAVVWRKPGVDQPIVDDRYVWVPQPRQGGLAVLDPATGETVATVAVCTWSLAVGATHAYAACNGQMVSINRETFAVEPLAPGEVILALDGERLYYLADDPSPWERWSVAALGPADGATVVRLPGIEVQRCAWCRPPNE